jgi:hypothetical protein
VRGFEKQERVRGRFWSGQLGQVPRPQAAAAGSKEAKEVERKEMMSQMVWEAEHDSKRPGGSEQVQAARLGRGHARVPVVATLCKVAAHRRMGCCRTCK